LLYLSFVLILLPQFLFAIVLGTYTEKERMNSSPLFLYRSVAFLRIMPRYVA